MNNDTLYKKISSLPDAKKKEVEAFIDAIVNSSDKKNGTQKAKAGTGKGLFVIKPGFDDPLEDFKEYM